MNTISLIGRLGRDPEVKYFEDGKVVGKVSIAVKRWNEGADWFSIECWGKTATVLADYCRKGDQIGVTGRMSQDEWTDRASGEKRTSWKVVVANLDLLAKAPERQAAQAAPVAAAPAATNGWNSAPSRYEDEDVPF
jgi:single-strand DNA-binding protein